MDEKTINVEKRDGSSEPYSQEKMLNLLKKVSEGFPQDNLDAPLDIAKLVVSEGVKTETLVHTLTRACVDCITTKEPYWNEIAGRLVTTSLYNKAKTGHSCKLSELYSPLVVSKHIADYVNKGFYFDLNNSYTKSEIKKAVSFIDPERDMDYGYSTANMLSKRYLLNPNEEIRELPQVMYLMIAMHLASPEDKSTRMDFVKDLYDVTSQQQLSLPTPTLLNARTKNNQLASCFVLNMDDDLNSIYHEVSNSARISKMGGGIGMYCGNIRAKGATIKGIKGASGGVVPFIKVLNDTGGAVNQLGKRNGAISVTLDMWHLDITDFLNLQTETGDIRAKCFDVFPAVAIPDLFMERVDAGESWTLFDPKEILDKTGISLQDYYGEEFKKVYKSLEKDDSIEMKEEIQAKELFKELLKTVVETGMPYVFFRDTGNELNPNKHVGMIYASNLCVSGDTKVLTKDYGYIEIEKVSGEEIPCWNGEEWSMTKLFQTSEDQDVSRVHLSNGQSIDATNYHRWIKSTGDIIETRHLEIGDKLSKFDLRSVNHGTNELSLAYENGFFTGDGTVAKSSKRIYLYNDKRDLKEIMRGYKTHNSFEKRTTLEYSKDALEDKFFIPDNSYTLQSRLNWLAGYLDADGTLTNNNGTESIQAASINIEFLKSLQLFLQELGVDSKISLKSKGGMRFMPSNDGSGSHKEYDCKDCWRILIPGSECINLLDIGYKGNRVMPTLRRYQRSATQFIKVVNIDYDIDSVPTYCGTEPKRNKLMFNGVMTMNCTEMQQNTSPSKLDYNISLVDRHESEIEVDLGTNTVCTLASINLGKVNEREIIDKVARVATRALDNVLDLNLYPTQESKHSASEYRSIGIGLMGLAEFLANNSLDYEKQEARDITEGLLEVVSYSVLKYSNKLSQERGAYPLFKGSEWSKGLIFGRDIDWYKLNSSIPEEWEELIDNIKDTGVRFSYHLSPAPNTSTAGVVGTTAGLLPIYKRLFVETNAVSPTVNVAPNLNSKNFWYYKEYTKCDMNNVIDMFEVVYKWIDQAASFEWQIDPSNTSPKDLYGYYFRAWEKGLKTVYYVRSMSASMGAEDCASCTG